MDGHGGFSRYMEFRCLFRIQDEIVDPQSLTLGEIGALADLSLNTSRIFTCMCDRRPPGPLLRFKSVDPNVLVDPRR